MPGHKAGKFLKSATPPWTYNGSTRLPAQMECHAGFLYEVHCTHTDRYYYGKKCLWVPRSGNPTDWPRYWGSSRHLHRDIRLYGLDSGVFHRRILEFYNCPQSLARAEVKLIHRKAKEMGTAKLYNQGVPCRGSVVLLTRIYPRLP